ncbi:unnamed protein product [Cochlearia groenlandica]
MPTSSTDLGAGRLRNGQSLVPFRQFGNEYGLSVLEKTTESGKSPDTGVEYSGGYDTWRSGGNRDCMLYGRLVEGWRRHKRVWMGSTKSTRNSRVDGTERGP